MDNGKSKNAKIIISGANNLASKCPELAAEWHPTKNGTLTPQSVSFGSTKKVWWQCKKGHEWQATVNNRSTGYGCPYCSGRRPIMGETDLATVNPRVAAEWHPTKNATLTPNNIGASSHKKVWWKCDMGHEWQAAIYSRIDGNGCPICSRRSHSSFPEQAVFFYIKKIYPNAINSYTDIFDNKMELDVFIPSDSIGIEYDGIAWHNTETILQREKKKYERCKETGIRLIRIKEGHEKISEGICDDVISLNKEPSYTDLNIAIKTLFELINISPNFKIDTESDSNEIRVQYMVAIKGKSLAAEHPEIAMEWHPTKNGLLTPDMIFASTHEKMWWRCQKGHEWQAAVYSRLNGNACPYCSGQAVLKGFNDLATTDPQLAAEWHPTKNLPVMPDQVNAGSKKEVWWLCKNGHEWKTAVDARRHGVRCPYCTNKKVYEGYNDLATLRPELAAEWHPTKNDLLKPQMIGVNSSVKVWWICPKGHEWETRVVNRSRGSGCPTCAKEKKSSKRGREHLSDINPVLAQEWHPTLNLPLSPSDVSYGSEKKVWWKCKKGHEWQASVKSRSRGTGCPYCANRKVLTGYNDLATINPSLAQQWHPTRNISITPADVCANSNIKVWWICENGHEWEAQIDNRNKGSGCPFCARQTSEKRKESAK